MCGREPVKCQSHQRGAHILSTLSLTLSPKPQRDFRRAPHKTQPSAPGESAADMCTPVRLRGLTMVMVVHTCVVCVCMYYQRVEEVLSV